MQRLSGVVGRIALAAPMAYETYRIGEANRRGLHLGVGALPLVVWGLVALGLLLGCVLVSALPRARWAWSAVAASGLFVLLGSLTVADLILQGHIPKESWWSWWFLSDAAIGAYAVLLASAFLFGRPKRLISVRGIGPEAPGPSRLWSRPARAGHGMTNVADAAMCFLTILLTGNGL